jgi:hypothetical protein
MVLEGAMVSIACICLTALHPGICFQGAWHDAKFNFRTRKEKYAEGLDSVDQESGVDLSMLNVSRNAVAK